MHSKSLKKFAVLSIAAAIVTISLKLFAYHLTGSVGLLSDALESCVNLLAAFIALLMIALAEKPADEEHAFGHTKAEYFSSAIEGVMIIIAAVSIIWSAIPRLLAPKEIENVGLGLLIALSASLVNLAVGLVLINQGKKNNSITLEADGKHLMTDVWTSVGVLLGIGLVKLTGWKILDPIIAIGVAINIIWAGYVLIKRSSAGLLDVSLSDEELVKINEKLTYFKSLQQVEFHSLMTRQAGQRKFVNFHMLVPGKWTIQQGHDFTEIVEKEIRSLFNVPVSVFVHIEPIEDPVSMHDIGLDRVADE